MTVTPHKITNIDGKPFHGGSGAWPVTKTRNKTAAACDKSADEIEDFLRRLHRDQGRRIAWLAEFQREHIARVALGGSE